MFSAIYFRRAPSPPGNIGISSTTTKGTSFASPIDYSLTTCGLSFNSADCEGGGGGGGGGINSDFDAEIARNIKAITGTTISILALAIAEVRCLVIITIRFLIRDGFEKLLVRLNALDLNTWLKRRL